MWPSALKGGYVGTTDHLYKRRPGGGHYDNFDNDYYDKYYSDDWYNDVDDYEDYYDRGFDKRRLDLGTYDYLDTLVDREGDGVDWSKFNFKGGVCSTVFIAYFYLLLHRRVAEL